MTTENKPRKQKKKRHISMITRHGLEGYMFVSPWIIGSIIFFLYAIFMSLQLSFSKVINLAGFETEWIGLANYSAVFQDALKFVPAFVDSLQKTLINTPLIVIFSLIIAILINRDIKARGFFRGVFFLPVLLGAGYVMRALQSNGIQPHILIPETLLTYLGPEVVSVVSGFLNRIADLLWRSSVQIILFLAGLQGISKSLYESARVDSATEWEVFWKITLPMVSPVVLLNSIYTVVDSFTAHDNPMLNYMELYRMGSEAFRKMGGVLEKGVQQQPDLGIAAAIGWIYFLFIMAVIGLIFWALRSYINKNIRQR